LKKALYGLKQAGRCWYEALDSFFVNDLNFTRLDSDHCIYRFGSGDTSVEDGDIKHCLDKMSWLSGIIGDVL
jgi:Reverse transcriptase (RNA-dependent DNA polymerase)